MFKTCMDATQYPFAARAGSSPIVVARAEGCHLILADGTRILDAAGGAVVASIGHGRREVGEAYARASAEVSYAVPPFATPARIEPLDAPMDSLPLPLRLSTISSYSCCRCSICTETP